MRERLVDAGDMRLNVAEGPPSGPPLVLLHGGSGRWEQFQPILPPLMKRWHVFAVDLRGHGGSDWTPGRYAISDNARDVGTILASVVPPSPVLFGHSFGSMVAVMVAASGVDLAGLILGDAPFSSERVRAAIAPDGDGLRRVRAVCGPGPPIEDVIAAVRSWPAHDEDGTEITFGEALADHPEEFAFAAETFAQHDPTFLDGVLDGFDRMWEGYEAGLLLPEITCPVLLVRCDPSAGGKLSDADVAVGLSMMPSADVVRLPHVGHLFFRGDPEATLAALTPFLERIRSV